MASPTCYKCHGPLAPATLNPKNLWCSVCAHELNQAGGPIASPKTNPPTIPKGEPVGQDLSDSNVVTFQSPGAPLETPPPFAPKSFLVTIGSVSFTTHGRVDLNIAGTAVSIT